MTDEKEVGRRIGAYLKLTGRKNKWFAEEMGWPLEKTSTILNGHRRIELIEFIKACRVLNVSYRQFISDDDLI